MYINCYLFYLTVICLQIINEIFIEIQVPKIIKNLNF